MSDDDSIAKTDAELAPLMEHFGERLNNVFSYFFFELEFEDDEDLHANAAHNFRTWRLQTIANASITATLIALRDIDDFLSRPKRHDDLRASDFQFVSKRGFLSKSEREGINKLIAHATKLGASLKTSRWDILELTTKCVSQSLDFLKWVEDRYGLKHFDLFSAAMMIRKNTEAQFNFIKAEAAKRRTQK